MGHPEQKSQTPETINIRGWVDFRDTPFDVRVVIARNHKGRECSIWLDTKRTSVLVMDHGLFISNRPDVIDTDYFGFTVRHNLSNQGVTEIVEHALKSLGNKKLVSQS